MVLIRIGVPRIRNRLLPRFPITSDKIPSLLVTSPLFHALVFNAPLWTNSIHILTSIPSVQPQISIIKFRFDIRFVCLFPILLLIDELIITIPTTTVKSVFHTRCSGLKFKDRTSVKYLYHCCIGYRHYEENETDRGREG